MAMLISALVFLICRHKTRRPGSQEKFNRPAASLLIVYSITVKPHHHHLVFVKLFSIQDPITVIADLNMIRYDPWETMVGYSVLKAMMYASGYLISDRTIS